MESPTLSSSSGLGIGPPRAISSAFSDVITSNGVFNLVPDKEKAFREAGFKNVTVIDRLDYFAHSSNENTKKAAKDYGAHTMVLTGQKI